MLLTNMSFAELSAEQISALKELEKRITGNKTGRKVYLLAVTDGRGE
ncbi:MAG: hypothetical protein AB1500_01695 [Bacillota bacterium]